MGTYILTWNPENWPWGDLPQAAQQKAGGPAYRTHWSTGNTRRIEPGDRLFLLKQGEQPRGIIAAGWSVSETYSSPHWDPERAARGDEAFRVDAEFERVLDPERSRPLATETFTGSLGKVYWAMHASGVQIPEAAAGQLESAWEAHLRAVDEGPADDSDTEKTPRNPPWQRDELILALDLYFRHPPNTVSQTHPEVVALSELLNDLPIHDNRPDAGRFRNPNGVYMKLCNFLRFDPSYQGKGLERGNRLEHALWEEFAGNQPLLRELAEAIRAAHSVPEVAKDAGNADEDEEEAFPEGKVLFRMHRARERSRHLVKRAKMLAIKKHGRLFCCVCQFDFAARYGEVGEGFIECHHTRPLSELAATAATRVSDLALVCSNCHRMIHRKRPWLTIDQLAGLLKEGG